MADSQIPQRDEDVVAYTAFGGVRNDVSPERFSPSDLEAAVNVNLDKSGRIARRPGYTLQRAGATHSLWADEQGRIGLCVADGALQWIFSDMSLRVLALLQDTAAPMRFTKVNDRIYASNATDTFVVENGRARSWGLPVPPLPGVAVTVGDMPAGGYQFVLTYLRDDGQESGAGLAGVVEVPDGAGLDFELPVPTDPAVVAKALYLTAPNGEVLYRAALFPAAAASGSYTNATTELGVPILTQYRQAAPAGQLVAYYRGRIFVAVGSVLFWSDPHSYELFDLRRYIDLEDRITMLAPMTDKEQSDSGLSSGFFIGTARSCGVLAGMTPDDFQYVPKVSYGAIEGALASVDGALFRDGNTGARPLPMWLTTDGICVGMPDLAVHNLTRSRYRFAEGGMGAALFMDGPNRFIATGNL